MSESKEEGRKTESEHVEIATKFHRSARTSSQLTARKACPRRPLCLPQGKKVSEGIFLPTWNCVPK
jgi:hypothetical protein